MSSNRLPWIDVARGFGILLVVYGHALTADSLRHIIYSFHMPLFFFLSGLVFSHRKYEYFSSFFRKNIQRILLPYFLFAFINFFIWVITTQPQGLLSDQVPKQLFGIFYGNGNNGWLVFNVVLWFLPCLFITRLVFWLISAYFPKQRAILTILVIFSVLGYISSAYFPFLKLPFGIESALTGVVFFGAGYLWHIQSEKLNPFLQKHFLSLLPAFLIICVLFAVINFDLYGSQIDLRLNRLHNYYYFYVAALSGVLFFLGLSVNIHHNRLLAYIGKHSLALFVWHLFVFSYFTDFFLLFMSENTYWNMRSVYLAPIFTIVSVAVILGVMAGFHRLRHVFKLKM